LTLAFSPDGSTFVAADKNGVMKFWNLAKLERQYLTLDASYTKGCHQLQEYLRHRQPADPSLAAATIESICKPLSSK
jgi:WD40 repeat protein